MAEAAETVKVAGRNGHGEPTEKGKGRKRDLVALSFASIVDGFEGGLINTLFPVIRDALNLQTSALGIMAAISRFARMLFGPAWAVLADKYGRKKILFIATGLWGVWTIAAGFAQNFAQLLILFSIGVIGTVAAEPITNGLITDMFGSTERGKAFGFLRTMSTAGAVLGTPLIGHLANSPDGWRWGMFLMGGISVLSGVLILMFVREPREHAAVGAASEAMRFNTRDAARLLKTRTILFMAVQVVLTTSVVLFAFFVTYFVDERGWSTANAATLMAIFMTGAVAGGLTGGFLGDWFERRFGPRGRIMLMQGYLAAYALSTVVLFQLEWGRGIAIYFVAFVTGLIGFIGHPGAVLPIVGSVVPKNVVATAYAFIFSFVQGLVAALFSLTFGFLADTLGLETLMFWLISIPYALNAVLWTAMYWIYPKDLAAERAREAEEPARASMAEPGDDQ